VLPPVAETNSNGDIVDNTSTSRYCFRNPRISVGTSSLDKQDRRKVSRLDMPPTTPSNRRPSAPLENITAGGHSQKKKVQKGRGVEDSKSKGQINAVLYVRTN